MRWGSLLSWPTPPSSPGAECAGSFRRAMEGNLRKMMRRCWLPFAERAARPYTAGPELADGVQVCRSLVRLGVATTICFWNGEGDSPRQTADAYLAALDALAREKLNCSLSVKAPPLGFARDLLAEILARGGHLLCRGAHLLGGGRDLRGHRGRFVRG